jgi:uncharacterized protein YhjY with autotransporter beta-barrel domain
MNSRPFSCRRHPLAIALHSALWSATLLPCAVMAQTVPAGNSVPVSYSDTGVSPPAQTQTGQPGENGGAGSDFTLDVQTPQNIRDSSVQSLIGITSTGGQGAWGGLSDAGYDVNGPAGGNGGQGGMLNVTLDMPDNNGNYSVLENFGNQAYGISLTSQGGSAGQGNMNQGDGNGGVGGTGGAGGNITFSMPANPGQPDALSFIEATGAAINLYSAGGQGGDSGDSAGGYGKKVTGRKGGSGGDGGAINATVDGNIIGYGYAGGSGVVATSVGGNGGDGGSASDYTAQATGSDGGDAGNGGDINITVAGGAVTAQGPDKAGTGPKQYFDSATTPGTVVALDTSISAGALVALSQGGIGGSAGFVNGSATKGGNGAKGGTGGNVEFDIDGSSLPALDNTVLSTTGYDTFGALAISAGGNGGDGNSGGGVYFRSGGAGGSGGNAGMATIKVANDTSMPYAKIKTTGDDADALVGISVGGGGGYSGDVNDSSAGGGAGFALYIGGVGGMGGNGSNATVFNGYYDPPPTDGSERVFHSGDVIITSGIYSRGLIAQSVGGGGGRGGDATSTSLASTVTIGGKGGNGGDGGLATAVNYGLISTSGQQSTGVFSQSVGGGGGSGGGALSRVIGAQVSASIAVGGKGGQGGDALEADAYNVGQVQTSGGNAHALFAQAVGGGGGVGGTADAQNYSTSLPDTPSISLTTTIGGQGGKGGIGGIVDVMNAGLLQTQGQDAYGIFAQSVGGGGGAGGDASATSMAYQQAKLDVTTSIGGNGGTGGDGNKVSVWNSGFINTSADKAMGIFAQSVGGGGGTGGSGTTDQGAIYQAGGYSTSLTVAVGGAGGASGNGNDVLVNNTISGNASDPTYFSDPALFADRDFLGGGGILTTGDMAAGIFAQSVGGGGGNGGDSTGKGSNGQLTVNVGVGGTGGSGGEGGNVTVHNGNGAILTMGAQSYGIFAQSVGGGGGTGGNAATGSGDDPEYAYSKQAAALAIGNSGFTKVTDQIWDWKDNVKGAWDDINRITDLYNLNNKISTGKPISYYGLETTDLTVDVGAGFGGKGGAAGDGETVIADSAGAVVTHGAMAFGIFGQSVGGGGGVGGASAPQTANDKIHDSVVESAIAVGGAGGKGGNGGTVTLTNLAGGSVTTAGDLGFGLFAQSVGGGGGVGGSTQPNAGIGNPMKLSLGSNGIDADNVVEGQGGTATVTNAGQVQTSGDNATGLFAQSVGGGGGVAAVMGQTLDSSSGLYFSTTQSLANGTVTPTLGMNYLATKDTGGNATVNLNSGGSVATQGVNAFAILAQSVGGGGGLIVVDPNNQVSVNQLASDPGNFAPDGKNNAGVVTVTTSQQTRITTQGDGAVGIVAQSLGGAGAIVNGFNGVDLTHASAQVNQNRWDMGMGGAVTVNNSSDITTTGAYAHGIFAQVASGSGGVIGRTDGTGTLFRSGMGETMLCGGKSVVSGGDCGGAAAVNLNAGTITVSGAHSWGVAMESENVSYQEEETGYKTDYSTAALNVLSGARIYARGMADGAVLLNATGSNTVTNAGVIDGSGSSGGYAVSTVGKAYKVTNEAGGVINGSFGNKCQGNCQDVTQAASTVNNMGLIETGDMMDLGGGVLTNSGNVAIQGAKTGTTVLKGDYRGTGTLTFDEDYAKSAGDQLIVQGNASINGTVTVNPVTMRNQQVALMTALDGLTVGPKLTASRSKLFSTRLDNDTQTLYATPEAHFSEEAAGFDAPSRAVANHLQSLFDQGVVMDSGFTTLSKVNSSQDYNAALRSMTGRALGSIGAFRIQSSRDFVSNLNQGCEPDQSADASCTWGRVQASGSHQDDTSTALGYHASAQTYEVGAQHALSDNLTLGASLGYENSAFYDGDSTGTIDGKSVLAGVGLRYNSGPFEMSGTLDAAWGRYSSERTIMVADDSNTAKSNPELWNTGLHLETSYTQPVGNNYVKPFAELRGVEVHSNSYTEHGDSAFNLSVDEQSQFSVGGGAGVELGRSIALKNGGRVKAYISAAVEATNGNDWETRAKFADVDSDQRFDVSTRVPATYGRMGVGVTLMNWKNMDVTVSYNPEMGSGYHSNTGIARMDWRF